MNTKKKTNSQRGKMARDKGKRFERQIANEFKKAGYEEACRSAQVRGKNNGIADVINVGKWHIECKAQEAMHLYQWYQQAVDDCKGESVPIVVHKQNNKPVLVTLSLEDFLREIGNANRLRKV